MAAMNCRPRNPVIALSPSALRAGWRPSPEDRDLWGRADIFLADTLFGGEAACPSEASRIVCRAVRPEQLHFSVADERDAVRAAAAYEQELRAFFGLRPGELPTFDLIVSGPAASVQAAGESSRVAVARYAARTRRSYVTLTDPVLRLARRRIVVPESVAAESDAC